MFNNLNELETREALEQLSAHIDSNGWVHLYNEIDYVSHLENKNAELLREKEKHEQIKNKIERAIQEIDKVTINLMKSAE